MTRSQDGRHQPPPGDGSVHEPAVRYTPAPSPERPRPPRPDAAVQPPPPPRTPWSSPPPPPPGTRPPPPIYSTPFEPVPYGLSQQPSSQHGGLKITAFILAIIGLGLILSRVVDLEPTLTAAPELSTVEPASLGVADDASLVVWFWSPW